MEYKIVNSEKNASTWHFHTFSTTVEYSCVYLYVGNKFGKDLTFWISSVMEVGLGYTNSEGVVVYVQFLNILLIK